MQMTLNLKGAKKQALTLKQGILPGWQLCCSSVIRRWLQSSRSVPGTCPVDTAAQPQRRPRALIAD